jgi:xanthine dehydrogenase iron-sulfur cluster and FAD-binding subunit A
MRASAEYRALVAQQPAARFLIETTAPKTNPPSTDC